MPEVYVFDFFGEVGSQVKSPAIRYLNGYLAQCAVPKQPPLRAWFWSWDPEPGDFDVLIFVVPRGQAHEVMKLKFPSVPDRRGRNGWTHFVNGGGDEAVSLVYSNELDAQTLAMVIFHEIMHNKLQLNNELHAQGGLASECVGAGCKPAVTGLNKDNILRMRDALVRRRIAQWKSGASLVFQKSQGLI